MQGRLIKVKENSEKMVLKLNMKKTKVMTTNKTKSFRTDNEGIQMVGSFCLGSTISSRGARRKEMHHRLVLGRAGMKILGEKNQTILMCLYLQRSEYCKQ